MKLTGSANPIQATKPPLCFPLAGLGVLLTKAQEQPRTVVNADPRNQTTPEPLRGIRDKRRRGCNKGFQRKAFAHIEDASSAKLDDDDDGVFGLRLAQVKKNKHEVDTY